MAARRTFTIALVGADGAGKTAVAKLLLQRPPLRLKYMYMGVNSAAATHMLPTTRIKRKLRAMLGHPEQGGPPPLPNPDAPAKRGFKRSVKGWIRISGLIAEEWFRAALAGCYRLRGFVVLYDRHFFTDYYAHDIQPPGPLPAYRRFHGFMLRLLYPRPHLLILLDAPAALLHARKPEGTLQQVAQRRTEYLQLGEVIRHFAVIDASQPLPAVTEQVANLILRFRQNGHV